MKLELDINSVGIGFIFGVSFSGLLAGIILL